MERRYQNLALGTEYYKRPQRTFSEATKHLYLAWKKATTLSSHKSVFTEKDI